ncbi:hypothetical protein [Actinacidiphila alni]|uniref:hypothetical protein n=1 Tax=Actinacidiphila alni TaxID=380248 RepID=UPI00345479EE
MTRPEPAVVELAGGPLQVFTDHRGGISTTLGLLGLVVAALVIANRSVRRIGGWRVVRRRLRRESRLTANAFTAPLRGWIRYRRQLRLLGRLLDDPGVWRTGERALRAAYAAAPGRCRPYGVLVGDGADDGLVGVLVAGRDVPEPPPPWIADDRDPRVWWSAYEEWHDLRPTAGLGWEEAEESAAPPVLIAAVGVDGGRAVFLDLAAGAPVTSLDGDERVARPLVQALAAQLDRRLPPGAVTVADGVHPRYAGPSAAQALRDAADWSAGHDEPAFVVCAAPLPDTAAGDGPRVLAYGRTHGRARLLTVDRDGLLAVHGTPLRVRATSLPRAVAAAIDSLPPYAPPPQPAAAPPLPYAEATEEPGLAGVSAIAPAARAQLPEAAGVPVVTVRQARSREAESGPLGVSAAASAGTPPSGGGVPGERPGTEQGRPVAAEPAAASVAPASRND